MYRRKDTFYQRAKNEGLRSRAAFKLDELARTHKLMRRGDAVLDLGAWPGGWLQIAADLVGPQGIVVGVDLRPIEGLRLPHVHVVTGDIGDDTTRQEVVGHWSRPFDCILSDLAPSLSGVRDRDAARAEHLLELVLEWATRLLRPDGALLVKLFMGPAFEPSRERLRAAFRSVKVTRPDATRRGSAEVYAIATGFRATQAC